MPQPPGCRRAIDLTVLPQVLLIEDDPSIRRFVNMALDGLPVQLAMATNLSEARSSLREGRFALVLTDLMLPDGSGLDLLQELIEQRPAWRGEAELAVFSAGVNDEARAKLARWGIHRILMKPISLADLERHVLECIQTPAAPTAAGPAPGRQDTAARLRAIDKFFGGDAALFDAFEKTCHLQFALDIVQADAAVAQADLAALRRLVHSLKTVLLTLGHAEWSALAARSELAAADALPEALPLWHELRSALQRLIEANRPG